MSLMSFQGALLILLKQQPTVQNEFANSISAFSAVIRRSASLGLGAEGAQRPEQA
jgi:hypothetical protein